MKLTHILVTAAVASLSFTACNTSAPTPDNAVEKRVEELLSQMTLEEKLGQMNQLSPWDMDDLAQRVRKGEVGSVLNVVNAEEVNKIQRVAVEESRLGIPLIVSRDVIHGYKTVFPIPLGQAASFNPDLVERGARVAAIEAAADGIRWTFAPMIDISRDARWGRIAESCGEDTYLTSVMGAAMIRGFQGDALNDSTSMVACAKHFVAYGAAEGGRDYNSTFIPERQLRNVYLPPFRAAVEAGCATFMTSFNDNDGIPATANKFVLRDILRDEWKFDGMVVTDWASAAEMVNHGFCADGKDVAEKAVNAGVDMEMVSETFIKNLPQLIREKKVAMSTIDEAVRNILRLKIRMGLFEQPYVTVPQSVKYAEEHLQAARTAVEQSVVMLKNEDSTLPLTDKVRTVAVVGPMADAPYEQLGTWTFDGERERTVTPLAAIRSQYGDHVNVIFEPALDYSRDKQTAGIARAVQVARRADVVLAFVGEEAILSGEAHSLAELNLQGAQSRLIKELAATGKPVVTVIMAGRPLVITDEAACSAAVLYAFHPGTMGGPALADILFGKVNPSGKLPVTFPRMNGQTPIYYAQNHTGRPANPTEMLLDSIPVEAGQTSVGCRSFYLDAGTSPLYPFGYGLSYTRFDYKNLKLSTTELTTTDTLTVTIDLKNAGAYDGTEVVQLYVQDKVGSVTRPMKELKDFQRVELMAGEEKCVRFDVPVSRLAFYGIDMTYGVEPGDFTLYVGTNSAEGLQADFKVKR